jgi:hypothetical protein
MGIPIIMESRVAKVVTKHLSKQMKISTQMKAWFILFFKKIFFLSYKRIHSHLDCIKWCTIEKDMPLQNKGPL